MKKLLTLTLLFLSLGVMVNVKAQNQELTSATATKDKGYTVLNAREAIVIYKYQHASHSPRETEKYAPKYFFTTPASNQLKELSKDNLKKAFPNAHGFHDALDANFKEDKELIAYDAFHKIYKINRIYSTTIK